MECLEVVSGSIHSPHGHIDFGSDDVHTRGEISATSEREREGTVISAGSLTMYREGKQHPHTTIMTASSLSTENVSVRRLTDGYATLDGGDLWTNGIVRAGPVVAHGTMTVRADEHERRGPDTSVAVNGDGGKEEESKKREQHETVITSELVETTDVACRKLEVEDVVAGSIFSEGQLTMRLKKEHGKSGLSAVTVEAGKEEKNQLRSIHQTVVSGEGIETPDIVSHTLESGFIRADEIFSEGKITLIAKRDHHSEAVLAEVGQEERVRKTVISGDGIETTDVACHKLESEHVKTGSIFADGQFVIREHEERRSASVDVDVRNDIDKHRHETVINAEGLETTDVVCDKLEVEAVVAGSIFSEGQLIMRVKKENGKSGLDAITVTSGKAENLRHRSIHETMISGEGIATSDISSDTLQSDFIRTDEIFSEGKFTLVAKEEHHSADISGSKKEHHERKTVISGRGVETTDVACRKLESEFVLVRSIFADGEFVIREAAEEHHHSDSILASSEKQPGHETVINSSGIETTDVACRTLEVEDVIAGSIFTDGRITLRLEREEHGSNNAANGLDGNHETVISGEGIDTSDVSCRTLVSEHVIAGSVFSEGKFTLISQDKQHASHSLSGLHEEDVRKTVVSGEGIETSNVACSKIESEFVLAGSIFSEGLLKMRVKKLKSSESVSVLSEGGDDDDQHFRDTVLSGEGLETPAVACNALESRVIHFDEMFSDGKIIAPGQFSGRTIRSNKNY